MLKNPKFYKYLGFALFICSAIVTMQFMFSTAIGFIAFIIASVQGTAIEACKSGFVYIAISVEGVGWKIFFGTLAFIAFIFSVVFTFGYSTNMNNKIKNEQMYSSEGYIQQQDNSTRQKDLYTETKKAIEDLKTQRDNQIAEMKKAKDQLPANYRTAKAQEQDKINKVTSDYKTQVEAKEQELKDLDGQLKGVKTEELPEDGYSTMYKSFAKTVNTLFAPKPRGKVVSKPWTAEDIEFWFQMTISLFLEFCGIGCLIYSQYINTDEKPIIAPKKVLVNTSQGGIGFRTVTATTKDNDDELQGILQDEFQTKRPIGFISPGPSSVTASTTSRQETEPIKSLEPLSQIKLQGFNKVDLMKYINFMYENIQEGNKSVGCKKIFDNVGSGSSLETFRKIRGHLETLQIIQTNGLKTNILCTKEECLKRV
jgi:hypothetical protein